MPTRDAPLIFRRKQTAAPEADAATLLADVEALSAENRERRDPETERRILDLRHRAGAALAGEPVRGAEFPEPDYEALGPSSQLPEFGPEQLSPELLRAGMLSHGCLLVRGLVGRDEALHMRNEIDRAFEAREALAAGRDAPEGYYEEFDPGPDAVDLGGERQWVTDGGLWAADSPKVMFDVFEAFERTGLRRVIHGYLGEVPAISIQKCTLRKVDPDSGSAWHQDGAFLGDVRALNVWLALSRCGDEAPGLDLVSRRLDRIVPTGTEDAIFDWSVAPAVAEEAAGEAGIVRPIFEPGDVLLFDEMNLHSTAADPAMPNSRYAIESWFFGLSGFPREYVPLAY